MWQTQKEDKMNKLLENKSEKYDYDNDYEFHDPQEKTSCYAIGWVHSPLWFLFVYLKLDDSTDEHDERNEILRWIQICN